LSPDFVENMKLPPPCSVEIYDIGKIVNHKSKLSTLEKIKHLIKLEEALLKKLDQLRGKRLPKDKPRAPTQATDLATTTATGGDKTTSDVDEDEPVQTHRNAKIASLTSTLTQTYSESLKASQKSAQITNSASASLGEFADSLDDGKMLGEGRKLRKMLND